jgi:hypothetical protein
MTAKNPTLVQRTELLTAITTLFTSFPTLAIAGFPRATTWRGYGYQSIAISRPWSGRNQFPLPAVKEMKKGRKDREKRKENGTNLHDIE